MPCRRVLYSGFVFSALLLGFVSQIHSFPALGHSGWTELNLGPFYLYTDGDVSAARDQLTQLEQLRWVLGGLLDTQDLPSTWPFRIVLTKSEKTNPPTEFVSKSAPLFGQREFVWKSGTLLPLSSFAASLLDDNTPRLPTEAESGLCQLLGSIEAHGSHVTWGGPVPHPDLAWARMQLFATKFEYSGSFHIFVTSLRNGSTIRVAERNAFNRDPDTLEKEAADNLKAGHWTAVPVSGRPLDPKRDFGEHTIPAVVVEAYEAAARLPEDAKSADAAFKQAVEAGGAAKAMGYEGLAALAQLDKENPKPYLENAIHAGSTSAPVYLATGDLKQAVSLNKRWAQPLQAQAELAKDPLEKEALLRKAVALAPRETAYWIELAETQIADGHVALANGSWLRAEDSAATPQERDRVHDLRLSKEQDRLEAEEAQRRGDRDAARLADQHAQDSEMARIHAAEQRANANLDAESGTAKPDTVVPWEDTVPRKNLTGTLLHIDCLEKYDRLSVKDRSGKVLDLLLSDPSQLTLTCGAQQPPRRITLTYAQETDERRNTTGRIVSLQIK